MTRSSSRRDSTQAAGAGGLQGPASTRLAPPRSTQRFIAREPLMSRLADSRRRRCIVIAGPAGSGKTTLLAAWRQVLVPLGFDLAWLSITPEDNEVARFLDALVASLAQVDAAIVREAVLLGGERLDADAVERLVISLVRGVAAHPRGLVLVLDDLHHLTHPDILTALEWLLDYAPPNLHLALSSRGTVRLSLDRLRAQGQVLEVGLRELRFSPAETEQFVKSQVGELDARTLRQMHELTDGWVAGLQLLCVEWKKKHPAGAAAQPEPTARAPIRDVEAFTRFFEQEVLSALPPEALETLTSLAPCSRFNAALCAALVGQPQSVEAAMELLARLEAEDLFVVATEGREADTWYRLHPLLRETLLARFAVLPADRRREVHARAWTWFRDHGLLDEAVRHAVQAGQAEDAAELVEQRALSIFARGERRQLIALLRELPDEQVRKRFGLRLWLARSQLYLRELDACTRSVDQMERDLEGSDTDQRFNIAMLRCALAVQRDDTDSAMALLPDILATPEHADALARGGRDNMLTWLYMHRGEYEKARRVQAEASRHMVNGMPLSSTVGGPMHGRALVGLSYALEGHMTQAERIYRAVIADAEQCGRACAETYYFTIALLSDVLYELNDTQAARALIEDKLDVLERMAIPDAVLRAMRLLSAAHWLAGNRLECFAYLERLEDYALRNGLDRLLAYSLADQVQFRIVAGETLAAEAEMARLEEVDARHPNAQQSALGEISDMADRARLQIATMQGDLDGAATGLAALFARCEARGRQRMAAAVLLKSAVIDARRGRAGPAREKAVEALRRGHRLGLMRTLLDSDLASRKLIGEVAQIEALDPVLAFYVERLQANQASPLEVQAAGGHAAAAATIEPLREREVEVLRLLLQAMPNKKIARALGLSPETVKWHLSRIYSKLGVTGRDEAVARARDLGLGS
ncbi:LuxR C-terminal-related transcriptional regulator [Variovorax sp. OV329]|uniref:LuxR C-terminal-related transcriptional regulator n=1 Tax=Variovorax sp. OV329 TaxID=1882825 RepID=UPI0008ECD4C2|nr:LuxR C-terminal-related transcriptional regulator [Variovorax sp. OV329]SFN02650.1 LuxR family transcriptional regulator, maltose regulon positive regulatory protein [Variovorax sp. OV329]